MKELLKIGTIADIPFDTLMSFQEFLVREPISKQFSGRYFKQFLYPALTQTKQKPLHLGYVSVPFIKLTNSLKGHTYTDHYIQKTYEHIRQQLKDIPFHSSAFEYTDGENIAIDLGAGNFLFCVDDTHISQIDSHISSVQNQASSPFVYAFSSCAPHSIEQCIASLDNQCSHKKIPLKEGKLKDTSANSEAVLALDLALQGCIAYFKDCFPHSNLEEKKKFYTLLLDSVLDNFALQQFPASPSVER